MLSLVAYFDACGHPSGKHALAVGGYISSLPAWLRFEKQWTRVLAQSGITIQFHMTDFMAGRKGFEGWQAKPEDQARLLLRLAVITKKHVRRSFSTMILLDAWDRVDRDAYALRQNHCTPYAICGFFTICKALSWLKDRERRWQAQFFFEDGDEHKGDFIWLMEQFIGRDKRALKGLRPQFERKGLAPFQACDFAMWEQFFHAKDRLRNPSSPAPLRQSFQAVYSIPKEWGVITERDLITFCKRYDVPKQGEARVWKPSARFNEERARPQNPPEAAGS